MHHTFKNVFNTVQNLDKAITEKVNNKKNAAQQQPVKSGGDSTQPTLIQLRPTSPPPPREATAKASEKESSEKESSEKEPDNDTFTVSEALKSTFQTALSILNDPLYKDKEGSYNMFSSGDKDDRIALNTLNKALDKFQGKKLGSNDVRTLKTLREKFHINEKIVYNESPSKQTPSKQTPSKQTPSKKTPSKK